MNHHQLVQSYLASAPPPVREYVARLHACVEALRAAKAYILDESGKPGITWLQREMRTALADVERAEKGA